MTETGLLIAQIVFLVLLFAFIASVVRSAARQLGRVQPPSAPYAPAVDPPRPAPAAEPAPAVEEPPAAAPWPDVAPRNDPPPDAAPEPVRQPTLEPFPSPLDAAAAPEPSAATAVRPIPVPGDAAADPEPDAEDGAEPADGPDGAPQEAAGEEPEPMTALRAGAHAGDLTSGITPKLVVEASPALEPGSDLELEGGLTIGRSGGADLSLSDQYVSHMHARILRRGPYYYVEDLGSTNGTFLNELRVDGRAQLKVHDSLRMGQTVLRYEE